jgi:hypothetical protein
MNRRRWEGSAVEVEGGVEDGGMKEHPTSRRDP